MTFQVETARFETLRPALGTEIRGGSCYDSQISWGHRFCKVLQERIETHSKTPICIYIYTESRHTQNVAIWRSRTHND